MSETGGPVYEGSANFTPPKKGMVEKLKQKASEVHLSETASRVRERVANRLKQNTGQIVEQKWMDAYQKTVDALDEGKRKNIAKKLKIVARATAKIHRIGSSVVDVVLRVRGLAGVMVGVGEVAHPQGAIDLAGKYVDEMWEKPDLASKVHDSVLADVNRRATLTPRQMRKEGAITFAGGLIQGSLGKARISAVASGWLADIVGVGGEKVAQITNKIFSGKPKAEVTSA